MKNVHVLPTDKPSRLFIDDGILELDDECIVSEDNWIKNQNIYITSDEEIKEGDYVYSTSQDYNIQKVSKWLVKSYQEVEHYKKIILTTDQDLIKDGVQAIDDEFLEWFVKNPSCEVVYISEWKKRYKTIIPKEDPKQQETLEEAATNYTIDFATMSAFKLSAKWQQDKMYSEEDIINALHSVELKDNKDYSKIYNGMKEWFEQSKNK